MKESRDPWISILAASKAAGCSRTTIYASIARGVLTGREVGGRMYVLRADLDAFTAPRIAGRRDSIHRATAPSAA